MLDHIHIENFRLFKHLDIPKVGQVNLITGKNNSGKTTLLEALRLWANQGAYYIFESNLLDILGSRGEINGNPTEGFRTIFHHSNTEQPAEINYSLKIYFKPQGPFLLAKFSNGEHEIRYSKPGPLVEAEGCSYIPPDFNLVNAHLWSRVELTPKEKMVAEIMRIIEPRLEQVRVNPSDNSARIQLEGFPKPLPIKNFGEGLNRLLTVALGLVNAENGMLLIDEIDLGLHHSVQHQLWEIVFQKAKDLNVQVFATTHSSDCVQAFSNVANKPVYANMGNYIRLQRSKKDGNIVAVEYEMEALDRSLDYNLETR